MLYAYQPKYQPSYDTNSDVEGHFQKLFPSLDRPEEERQVGAECHSRDLCFGNARREGKTHATNTKTNYKGTDKDNDKDNDRIRRPTTNIPGRSHESIQREPNAAWNRASNPCTQENQEEKNEEEGGIGQ
jgi:hypothetical protein